MVAVEDRGRDPAGVGMPGADGVEVMREPRRRASAIPVVAMSGGLRGDAQVVLQVTRFLGAKRTIEKPFPLETIGRVLDEVTRV
jgi:FixJ family two-component response regulator